MPVTVRKFYSQQEYLEMERLAFHKHEFFRGEIFRMARSNYCHSLVITNLIGEVLPFLDETPWKMLVLNMRIHIQENTLFTYPDAVITGDKPAFIDNHEDTLLNPAILFEVLTPATREYDLTTKFEFYKDIPWLNEYVTINSSGCSITVNTKDEAGTWAAVHYDNIKNNWRLKTIGFSGPAAGLYG
jgi:Uma2 family endonuclease